MESKVSDLNGEVFEGKITSVMAATSEIFLTLETKFLKLKEAKLNGEEIDMEEFNLLSNAVVHASHAMGELMETKAAVFGEENLNLMDRMLLIEYEKEMNTHLRAFLERDKFNDILNGDDNGDE